MCSRRPEADHLQEEDTQGESGASWLRSAYRLPPPSEFTTSSGISSPRIGSGGSTVVRNPHHRRTLQPVGPSTLTSISLAPPPARYVPLPERVSSIGTRKEYVVGPASHTVVRGPFLSASSSTTNLS